MYFFISNVTSKKNELWVSSGTAVGTHLVKNVDPTGNLKLATFGVVGSKFFFVVSDENAKANTLGVTYKLWVSDGTAVGTQMLRSFNLPEWRSWFDGVTAVGSKLYFFVSDPTEDQGGTTHGTQLWSSDGTLAGTKIIKNINPTNDYCCPDGADANDFYIALGSKYLFTATDGTHGFELWSSDGTDIGTQAIRIVNPNVNYTLTSGAQIVNKRLFFDVSDGTVVNQLWVTDGTRIGTNMVKIVNPDGNAYFGSFTAIGPKLYFAANDGVHGNELWVSDGTGSGTRLIRDINPRGNSNIGNAGKWGSKLYFMATDGTHGNELWTSNGTLIGTRMIKDINPKGDSSIQDPIVVGRSLYFTADDGVNGRELWVSDGSPNGTHMVKDISPHGDSTILNVIGAGSLAYFLTLLDSQSGSYEMWSTDGTTAGTQAIETTTVIGTKIFGEAVLGSKLFFGFENVKREIGLWKIGA